MENRKLVSWRLEKLEKNQQDTINKWLNAQQNIQLSLTNVVQHMIDRYGITDIMNYDVQKALYTNPDAVMIEKPLKGENIEDREEQVIVSSSVKKIEQSNINKEQNENDLYDDLAGDL